MLKRYHTRVHFAYSYPAKHHLLAVTTILILASLGLFWGFAFIKPVNINDYQKISFFSILLATALTLSRLIVAYSLALVAAIPIGLLTAGNPKVEKLLLPIFDILQSIPVLAFFPVIVLVFIKFSFYEGAAVFILFMTMVWNLTFSVIAGLKTIPSDISSAALVFKARGLKKIIRVSLPAIFPYLVTGSILAVGSGWTIIIVAEALHNYIPQGHPSQDLFGLGSLLVNAALSSQSFLFVVLLLVMIMVITFINFFIWQSLLHLSERFKFE